MLKTLLIELMDTETPADSTIRGNPVFRAAGFLRLLDERTLAFADYRGNRQYISTGSSALSRRCQRPATSQFRFEGKNRSFGKTCPSYPFAQAVAPSRWLAEADGKGVFQ